jgi:hypothetical protein
MTIAEAIQSLTEDQRQNPTVQPTDHDSAIRRTFLLLGRYFSPEADLNKITPVRLRDFVARWYVEEASALIALRMIGSEAGQIENSGANDSGSRSPQQTGNLPGPIELLLDLERVIKWMNVQTSSGDAALCLSILSELQETLPHALEINHSLSKSLQERQGAFSFPEFLTSFEEGGSSQYDIDAIGNIGAIDGFFRIIRVEGNLVEAQEVISDERIWPIIFPPVVAPLLNAAYVINLELVRDLEGWQIAGCGFTYPPGTEF